MSVVTLQGKDVYSERKNEIMSYAGGHPAGPVCAESPSKGARSPQQTPQTPTEERPSARAVSSSPSSEGSFTISPSGLPLPSTRMTSDGDYTSEDSRESSGSARSARALRMKKKSSGSFNNKVRGTTPRKFSGETSAMSQSSSALDMKRLQDLLGTSLSRLDQLELDKMGRYERYKHEAIEHGLKLMEEERKRSDEAHNVLVKRIEFLTRELEEARLAQAAKTRECEELLEVAEELARDRRGFGDDVSFTSESSYPRNWLQSPETSLTPSPEKLQKKRECRACGTGSFLSQLGFSGF